MSLIEAASSGDRLAALKAQRDDLARRMAVCTSDQNYGTLGRLFKDVLADIESTEKAAPEKKGTALDELAAKRAAAGHPDASGVSRTSR